MKEGMAVFKGKRRRAFLRGVVSFVLAITLACASLVGVPQNMRAAGFTDEKTSRLLTVIVDGKTIYTGNGANGTVNTGITLYPGSMLSFSLTWTVTDKQYIFQDGDQLLYDILSIDDVSHLSLLPPRSGIPLTINGVLVGTGSVDWGGVVGKTVEYTVTFNDSAKNVLIGGGTLTGSAQFNLEGNEIPVDLVFEDTASGSFTVGERPTGGGGGSTGGGSTGSGIGAQSGFAWLTPPTPGSAPDLTKSLVNTNLTSSWPSYMGDPLVQVPDQESGQYGDGRYYGFTWYADFYGLQDRFEADPWRTPTDYVIIEDVLSSNMRFAGFRRTGSGYNDLVDPNMTGLYGREVFGDATKYFSLEIRQKTFGYRDYGNFETFLLSSSSNLAFMWQDNFTPMDTEAEVRATPLSYTIVDLPDGRQKLVINLGRFGANVPDGENLNWDALTFRSYSGPQDRGTHLLHGFLNYQINPYLQVLYLMDSLENNLKTYPSWTPALEDEFNALKADLETYLQGGNVLATYDPGDPIPTDYRFYADTSSYAIRDYIYGLTGNNGLPSGDPLYSTANNTKSIAMTVDARLAGSGYQNRMNGYINGEYNDIARQSLRSLLFYFPLMKDYFNNKLSLGLTGGETFEEVVAAIITSVSDVQGLAYSKLRQDYEQISGYRYFRPLGDLKDSLPQSYLAADGHNHRNDMAASAVRLYYRTILVDVNDTELTNTIKFSTTDYEKSLELIRTHSYNAGIWGVAPGQIGLVKADRFVNNKTVEWETFPNNSAGYNNFMQVLQGIEDAAFEVRYADGDAALWFELTDETDGIPTYTRRNAGAAGSSTLVATGKNGMLKLSMLDSPVYLKEISAAGYYVGAPSASINPAAGANVAMYDVPSAVALRKYDEDGSTPLNGAIFNVYANTGGGSTLLDGLTGGFTRRTVGGITGYWYNPKGTVRDLITDYRLNWRADADKGFIYVFALPDGDYKFVETKAPAGYVLAEPPYEFPFTVNASGTPGYKELAEVSAKVDYTGVNNTETPPPEIRLLKVSTEGGVTPMPSVGFKLAKTENFTSWDDVAEMYTDWDGLILWNDAYLGKDFAGTYMLVETTYPNLTPIDPIMFDIDADGRVLNVQMGSNDAAFVSYTNAPGVIEFTVVNAITDPADAFMFVKKSVLSAGGRQGRDFIQYFEFALTDENRDPVDLDGEIDFVPESDGTLLDAGEFGGFLLRDGAIAVISGLNDGEQYFVTEYGDARYATSVKDEDHPDTPKNASVGSITAEAGKFKTIEFINQERGVRGSLYLTKQVAGAGADAGKEFHFTVSFTNPQGDYSEILLDGNPFSQGGGLSLRDGEEARFTGIPLGSDFTVAEDSYEADHYASDQVNDSVSGSISSDDLVLITFVNTYKKPSTPPGGGSGGGTDPNPEPDPVPPPEVVEPPEKEEPPEEPEPPDVEEPEVIVTPPVVEEPEITETPPIPPMPEVPIGPDGVPLGEWVWDEDQGVWIFNEYPPLVNMEDLPTTGLAKIAWTDLLGVAFFGLFGILALACTRWNKQM